MMTKTQILKYKGELKHLYQKGEKQHTWIFSFVSIALGFLIGFLVMLCVNPKNAGQGFALLLTGGFNNGFLYSLGNILFNCTPFIGVGLAVAISSKAGVFNIGGSGQYIVGGGTALIVANLINNYVPQGVGFFICLLTGMVAGGIYALIPALLKNHFNVNIVVSAIMLNYIATFGMGILAKAGPWYDSLHYRIANTGIENCKVPTLGLGEIFSYTTNKGKLVASRLDMAILLCILICIILFFIFKKTTFGYKIQTAGQNETAAKYSGIDSKRQISYAMFLSGAMAGMGAVFSYLAQMPANFQPVSSVSQMGFTGISIALIANNNPIAVIFSSLLISYIQTSGGGLTSVDFNSNIIGIISSVIIYSSATSFLLAKLVYSLKTTLSTKKKQTILTNGLLLKEETNNE